MQSGDTLFGIGARFSIEPHSLGSCNRTPGWDLQVGDALVLRPDPDVPWRWEG